MTNYVKLTCRQFSPDPKPEKVEKKKPVPIKKVSAKRAVENKEYLTLRKVFLENHPICPITGEKTVDIHHKKGRIGKLLCDIRYWLAVSRKGHDKIENNPEWAYEMGYSLLRTAK